MNPVQYFPSTYIKDLSLFLPSHLQEEQSCNGPVWMLCLMTMGMEMLQPKKWVYYNQPTDFACCQYVLNLVYRGLHCYFPEYYYEWCRRTEPFLDTTACPTDHGGFSQPFRIIYFTNEFIIKFRQDFEKLGKRIIPLDKRDEFEVFPYELVSEKNLRSYIEFFFQDHMPKLNIPIHIIRGLIEKLKTDRDCPEFMQYSYELSS
jgi:hypothetical protein